MKLKSIYGAVLLVTLLGVFSSCRDEEGTKDPKLFFEIDGQKISLVGANLYLRDNYMENDRLVRRYIISDGEYHDSGWDFEDLEGATYRATLLFSMGDQATFAPGDFNALSTFSSFPSDNAAFFSLVKPNGDAFSIYNTPVNDLGEIISVSGGLDEGQTMIIDFEDIFIESEVETTGTLHFEGVVHDRRP